MCILKFVTSPEALAVCVCVVQSSAAFCDVSCSRLLHLSTCVPCFLNYITTHTTIATAVYLLQYVHTICCVKALPLMVQGTLWLCAV